MQSVTSFFDRALFRRDLQRFWPLWFGYTLLWLLILPLTLLNQLARASWISHASWHIAKEISHDVLAIGAYGGLAMAAIFGIFFAMAMFSYLTAPRATQGFHSMPVRRETLYATNYLAGLACMVSSIVLAFALAGVTAALFDALDLAAFGTACLAAVLAVVFFYSFAVLCMMFTGQILAAPVFYGILNFLAVGMEYLVRNFAGTFLYGYSGYMAPETLAILSPIWRLAQALSVRAAPDADLLLSDGTRQIVSSGGFVLYGMEWLGIYAAVGVVFALLGLLVYRKRPSEVSGSIVTVAWARPVFKYGVALCAAFSVGQLVYYLIFGINLTSGEYSLAGTIACMLFAGLLGYFAAEMLLEKSFRVWRKGRVGAVVFSAVLVCFGVGMSLDLTGFEGYVPAAERVESVSVYLSSTGDYFHGKFSEPESVGAALAAHRAVIADKDRQLAYRDRTVEQNDNTARIYYFELNYTLTDGRVVRRRYEGFHITAAELKDAGSIAQTATALLNCPEAARSRALGELPKDSSYTITGGYYNAYRNDEEGSYAGNIDGELTAAQASTLVSALRRDYEAGRTANASLFEDTRYNARFRVELELWYIPRSDGKTVGTAMVNDYGEITKPSSPAASRSIYVIVTPDMSETLGALAEMGVEMPAF